MAALTAFGDSGLDQALSAILQIEERVPAIKLTAKKAGAPPRRARPPQNRPAIRRLWPSRAASVAVAALLGLTVLGAAAVTLWNTLPGPAVEDRIAEARPDRVTPITAAVPNVVERTPDPQAPAFIHGRPVELIGASPGEQTASAVKPIVQSPPSLFVEAARSAERRTRPVTVRRVSRLAAGQSAAAVTMRSLSLTAAPENGSRQTQDKPRVQVAAVEPTTTITVPFSLMQPGSPTPRARAADRAALAETPPSRKRRDIVDAIRSLRRQW